MPILGSGPLAAGAASVFQDVPFTWILYQPPLRDISQFAKIPAGTVCVISTPMPVGTMRRLAEQFTHLEWAVMPENVREAHPEDWKTQDRYVVGTESVAARKMISDTFGYLAPIEFMSPESAEMVKHGINGFLALSVRYALELARVATIYGADPEDVARGLQTDSRIGFKSYLRPVGGVSPHLQREVENLYDLGFQWSGIPPYSERLERLLAPFARGLEAS